MRPYCSAGLFPWPPVGLLEPPALRAHFLPHFLPPDKFSSAPACVSGARPPSSFLCSRQMPLQKDGLCPRPLSFGCCLPTSVLALSLFRLDVNHGCGFPVGSVLSIAKPWELYLLCRHDVQPLSHKLLGCSVLWFSVSLGDKHGLRCPLCPWGGIVESLRMEETFKITQSNSSPRHRAH